MHSFTKGYPYRVEMVMNKFYVLVLFLCFDLSQPVWAQRLSTPDSLLPSKALDAVYKLQFDGFEKIASNFIQKDQVMYSLLKIFALRWKEVPVAYSQSSHQYHDLLLKELAMLEKEKNQTPMLSYYKICTYLFLSEYYFSLDEKWSALKYAQKAYPLVMESFEKNYTQPEFQFIKGLYLYYIEYYRKKNLFYRAALFAFHSGNQKKGLELLKTSAGQFSMAQVEAKIFLAHIYLHLENKPFEALPYSKELTSNYPTNLKLMELYTNNLVKCKMYREAMTFVDQLENQKNEYYSIPGYFYRGVIEDELFNDKEKAKTAYQRCLQTNYKPVEAYQKLATQRLKKLSEN